MRVGFMYALKTFTNMQKYQTQIKHMSQNYNNDTMTVTNKTLEEEKNNDPG